MTHTTLHMTIVQCQKLQHIVGQGSASPYQVTISEGSFLGKIGKVVEPENRAAANEDNLFMKTRNEPSWIQRMLSSLRLK